MKNKYIILGILVSLMILTIPTAMADTYNENAQIHINVFFIGDPINDAPNTTMQIYVQGSQKYSGVITNKELMYNLIFEYECPDVACENVEIDLSKLEHNITTLINSTNQSSNDMMFLVMSGANYTYYTNYTINESALIDAVVNEIQRYGYNETNITNIVNNEVQKGRVDVEAWWKSTFMPSFEELYSLRVRNEQLNSTIGVRDAQIEAKQGEITSLKGMVEGLRSQRSLLFMLVGVEFLLLVGFLLAFTDTGKKMTGRIR